MYMHRKIRIYPNKTQIKKCEGMFGACRFVYNNYISDNYINFLNDKKLIGWKEYRKVIKEMREYDYPWLKEYNKHALDQSAKHANEAYTKFIDNRVKGLTKKDHPSFKSKKSPVQSFYLDDLSNTASIYHKHIKLPYLGKVRVTESNYIDKNMKLIGVTIKKELDKYYASFTMETNEEYLDNSMYSTNNIGCGYGLDMGVKTYITLADSYHNIFCFPSFLNDKRILKLEKKIEYLQRIISNKMEINYSKLLDDYLKSHSFTDLKDTYKNIMKGESYSNKCRYIQKKINKLKKQITDIKNDIINKIVINIAKLKPEFITVETLDIKDMLMNDSSTTLHRHIQDSKIRYFFDKLEYKCKIYSIELRKAYKYFASSKICYICGHKKKNLKLSDRVYKCDKCSNVVDRDVNASLNLVDLDKYILIN